MLNKSYKNRTTNSSCKRFIYSIILFVTINISLMCLSIMFTQFTNLVSAYIISQTLILYIYVYEYIKKTKMIMEHSNIFKLSIITITIISLLIMCLTTIITMICNFKFNHVYLFLQSLILYQYVHNFIKLKKNIY